MSLMVGVSGIRGLVGSTLTPQLAARAGCAFAAYTRGGLVVVGRDSRSSGEMVQAALVSGLLAGGCPVVELGIVSTPGVGFMVGRLQAKGGVVITASHNPAPWNGIKFLTAEGAAPPADLARRIISIFESGDFQLVEHEQVGRCRAEGGTHEQHVQAVLATVNVAAIRRRRFRVVLDSVNGAGGTAGRMLLEALGCQTVHINAEPTGSFAHAPEPVRENLGELCGRTRSAEADVGFAQDPDADRLAIVNERGEYIGEEYTLALAVRHVLKTRPGPLCANLSTSRMIDDLAAQAVPPCVVWRSAVGEANVVELMRQHGCVIGGEGNGGVIDPRVVFVRDSLVAMALTLDLLAAEGRNLSTITADLPAYAMVKEKFEVDRARVARVLTAVQDRFANERLSTIDGIRIDWPQGWVHIRGSNTEPIMRVIAEARDAAAARELVHRVRVVADAV